MNSVGLISVVWFRGENSVPSACPASCGHLARSQRPVSSAVPSAAWLLCKLREPTILQNTRTGECVWWRKVVNWKLSYYDINYGDDICNIQGAFTTSNASEPFKSFRIEFTRETRSRIAPTTSWVCRSRWRSHRYFISCKWSFDFQKILIQYSFKEKIIYHLIIKFCTQIHSRVRLWINFITKVHHVNESAIACAGSPPPPPRNSSVDNDLAQRKDAIIEQLLKELEVSR